VTSLPFQSFDLPQKLSRECHLAPKALITGVAPEAHVHVTHSRLQGSPENAQLLFVQVKNHHGTS
jgi:hypothetical protein